MLTISRIDGSVTGDLGTVDPERLWEAMARTLGPQLLEQQEQNRKEEPHGQRTC